MTEIPIESVISEVVMQAWRGGETAMRKQVLAHIEYERRILSCRHGVAAEHLETLDKLINIIEAIPLTELKK